VTTLADTRPPQEPTPPSPKDGEDAARWEFTRKARRILYGRWDWDLERRVQLRVGQVKREAWAPVDLSANSFKQNWSGLAKLYVRSPVISHVDRGAAERMKLFVDESGLWQLMQRVQRDTLGLREMLLRIDVVDEALVFEPVFPDMVVAKPKPDVPYVPRRIEWAVERKREETGRLVWTWEIFDIDGEGTWAVMDARQKTDLSDEFLPADRDGYSQFTTSDGTPILPFTLYHAAETGRLWDAWQARELVEGTLELGVKYTFLGHQERNASWPQRYMVDCELAVPGVVADEDGNLIKRREIVADPSVVLPLNSREDGRGQPQIGQWDTSADVEQYQGVIDRYDARLFSYTGAQAPQAQRDNADPRSGYAISLNKDAQREAQRQWEPLFRRGDENTIAVAATLLNRDAEKRGDATWVPLPETGWRVTYQGIPMSREERKALEEHLDRMVKAGLMSEVEAMQELHPELSEDEAFARLVRIRIERKRLDVATDKGLLAAGLVEPDSAGPTTSVELAPTDLATVIKVNEARAQQGLGPVDDGDLTISEFRAKKEAERQAAGAAATPPQSTDEV